MATRTYAVSVVAANSDKVIHNIIVKETDGFGGSYKFARWASGGQLDMKLGYNATAPMPLQVALMALDGKLRMGVSFDLAITASENGSRWKVSNEQTIAVAPATKSSAEALEKLRAKLANAKA